MPPVKGFCDAGVSIVGAYASVCEPSTSAELGGPLVDTALPWHTHTHAHTLPKLVRTMLQHTHAFPFSIYCTHSYMHTHRHTHTLSHGLKWLLQALCKYKIQMPAQKQQQKSSQTVSGKHFHHSTGKKLQAKMRRQHNRENLPTTQTAD